MPIEITLEIPDDKYFEFEELFLLQRPKPNEYEGTVTDWMKDVILGMLYDMLKFGKMQLMDEEIKGMIK